MLVPLRSTKSLNFIHGQGDISPIKKLFLKREINCKSNKMFHFLPYPLVSQVTALGSIVIF